MQIPRLHFKTTKSEFLEARETPSLFLFLFIYLFIHLLTYLVTYLLLINSFGDLTC